MAAGGMNASTASPDTSGYSGPAPVGGGPSTSAGYDVNNTGTPPPSTIYGGFLRPSSGGSMGSGGKQAGNPMPPPSGSLDAYAQPYSGPVGVNPAAFNGPPSMTPTPPTNPLPAPPQPQVQPAVMPPYGGGYQPGMGMGMERPQMSPPRQFRMGYPDRYAEMPADRIPQREMFDRGPFGRREPQPGGPTWSQQGGVYSYDPNGRPGGGGPFDMFRNMAGGMPEGFNPFGGQMPSITPFRRRAVPGYSTQDRQIKGLGAIKPYARKEEV